MSSCSNRSLQFGLKVTTLIAIRSPREHKNIGYTRNIIYVGENENMRPDSNTKRYYKTQALMGATRLASGKMQCLYTKQRLTDITNYTQVCEPLL